MKGTWLMQPQNGTVVIFIHGVMSDAGAWRSTNGTYWPSLLAEDPPTSGVGIYIFEYETGLFSGTSRINDAVDALKNHLRLDKVLTAQRLVFVCHSMGGIVTRRYWCAKSAISWTPKSKLASFWWPHPPLDPSIPPFLALYPPCCSGTPKTTS